MVRTPHGYLFGVGDELGAGYEVDELGLGEDLTGVVDRETVQQVQQYYHYEEYETDEDDPAYVRIGIVGQIARVKLASDHDERFEDRQVGSFEFIWFPEQHVEGETEREDQKDVERQALSEVHGYGLEHLDVGGHPRMLSH